MAETSSPKTPEKTVDDVMVDLTLAPRKMKRGPCLANFLHEPLDNVKRREVRLSTTDSDERITYDTSNDPTCF